MVGTDGWSTLIVLAGLMLSVLAGWGLVELVFQLAKVAAQVEVRPKLGGHDAVILRKPEIHVLRGGMWIGVLERLCITGAVLAGAPSLIAAVVAIKGLGRWSELQAHPSLTERFIIGTRASYFAAAACGYLAVWGQGML